MMNRDGHGIGKRALLLVSLLVVSGWAGAATLVVSDPQCSSFVLSNTPPTQTLTCVPVGGNPPPPPPPTGNPPPPPPPVVGAWNDNQRLWIVAATGHPDTELMNRIGYSAYTNGIQDRSTSGRLYDPVLQQQASMAAGGNLPPQFTWASYVAQGKGSIVNGVFVWSPSMYPLFLALR